MATNGKKKEKKREILVTGASSGIGHCVAHGLSRRGYRVFAAARKLEDVKRLRDEGLESVHLDLANSASIHSAVDHVLDCTGGRLYGLFNNAGYGQPGAVEDLSRDALREQFEVNVFGPHELARRVIPIMRGQHEGRIIQNGSVLGIIALTYRGAYNGSKFALRGLSETLRLELRGSGVHVSLVEPGPILSRFRENSLRAYRRHIDARDSVHRDTYEAMLVRLKKEGAVVPFTLPPEAVLRKVIPALESKRPKAHYFVTFPTYLFSVLRRALPYRYLEAVLAKV